MQRGALKQRTSSRRQNVRKAIRTRLPAEALKLWTPREARAVLADMRVFAECDRRQLARIGRWGEVVEAGPEQVLVREDYTDYWFFVILQGSVRVSRRGREIATLHRGQHFGELAIVGFRPQPATVRSAGRSVLFVLSRQVLLSLVALDRSIQHALYPDVEPAQFTAFRRRLQAEGRRAWDTLVPRQQRLPREHVAGTKTERARPGRTITWDQALEQLSHLDRERWPGVDAAPAPLPTWARIALAGGVLAIVACLMAFFHPPMAVVTASEPVDIARDISIVGVPVHQPTGKYLMTTVNVERPTLGGLLYSWSTGQRVVSTSSRAQEIDPDTQWRLAHEAFVNSHRQAIALAKKELGVDASGVSIAIRDRGVTGPSAGLIYAIALADMLDRSDLAGGRVIAATGVLRSDQSVGRVSFVELKARAARDAKAALFLVPHAQRDEVRLDGLRVVGVADLKAALRALERES